MSRIPTLIAAAGSGLLSLVLLVTTLGAAIAAPGERSAFERIQRMVNAARMLNYDATFVYSHGPNMDMLRIIHSYTPEGERERLVTLSGVAREVLRDDTRVTCILPDDQAVVVGKSRPQSVYGSPLLSADVDYLPYYELSVGGMMRIAGRSTEEIRVEPRDSHRYGYRLWLDEETGLLLKFQVLSETNAVLEQITYTSMRVTDHIPEELLEPEITGAGFTWYTTPKDQSEVKPRAAWTASWVPKGFVMRDSEAGPLPTGAMPVEHLVYSDGLATFSVFIETLDNSSPALEGASRVGSMNAFGRMLGKHQITVVGELPRATVAQVANSVQPVN